MLIMLDKQRHWRGVCVCVCVGGAAVGVQKIENGAQA